jgi:hypothetical protein
MLGDTFYYRPKSRTPRPEYINFDVHTFVIETHRRDVNVGCSLPPRLTEASPLTPPPAG